MMQTTMVAGGKTKSLGLDPKIAIPALNKVLEDPGCESAPSMYWSP